MTPAIQDWVWIHASAVVVREAGVLIRGPSGAGKTTLAFRLLAEAGRDGNFAAFVADDRCGLAARSGRLVARGHPAVLGLAERRFWGLVPVESEPWCVVRLVVDLALPGRLGEPMPQRLPDPDAPTATLCRIACPALTVPGHVSTLETAGLILHRLGALRPSS